MNKKNIIILSTIIVLSLLIAFLFPIPVLHEKLANSISSPCGYENNAWGYERGECVCEGFEIDTTCLECSDAGTSYGCIGTITEKHCYMTRNQTEIQVSCV